MANQFEFEVNLPDEDDDDSSYWPSFMLDTETLQVINNGSESSSNPCLISIDAAVTEPASFVGSSSDIDLNVFDEMSKWISRSDMKSVVDVSAVTVSSNEKRCRQPLQAHHHVMSERRRREKLNQNFIALSALIPGLKKMDKATIVENAGKYIKDLQDQLKSMKNELGVFKILREISSSSSCNDCDHEHGQLMKVRILDLDVLIMVECGNDSLIMAKVMSEIILKFDLSISSCSSMPFGHTSLAITIVAKMDGKSSPLITEEEILKVLSSLLLGTSGLMELV